MSDMLVDAVDSLWGKPTKQSIIITPPDDPEDEPRHITLDDEKKIEDTRKVRIHNEKELNNLILKTLIQAMLEKVGQSIQVNFVDLARRESPTIAAIMGVPEKERELEKLLGEKIQAGIVAVQGNIDQLIGEDTFL